MAVQSCRKNQISVSNVLKVLKVLPKKIPKTVAKIEKHLTKCSNAFAKIFIFKVDIKPLSQAHKRNWRFTHVTNRFLALAEDFLTKTAANIAKMPVFQMSYHFKNREKNTLNLPENLSKKLSNISCPRL
jgi:hypothetical protein